jgi:hypothetical protein
MSNSDILNNFIKIAQEKGLISDKAPEKTKQILEKTHRADSLSVADIEKLYGIKPDMAKDNKYSRNIVEDAHPESYVALTSHDKLNGLVENINQRQDIILHILNKTPNGHLTQHKYAEKDFILSLVRIGNDLDNQDKDKLRVLADTCLMQVSKPMKKEGIAWGLVAIPVLLGTLYLQQHMSFTNEGFEKNYQKLSSEIDDLLQSSSSWGVGYDYKSDFKTMVGDFKGKLDNFYSLYSKATPIITDLEKPRTAKELIELSKQPQTDSVVKAYGVLKAAADNMLPYITTIEKNFSSEAFKARQIEDKGFMSSIVDRVQLLHGGKGLVADDFDDVVRAIAPYKQSVKEIVDLLKNAESIEKSAQQKIQEASSGIQEEKFDAGNDSGIPVQPKNKKPLNIDDEVKKLEDDLTGGL